MPITLNTPAPRTTGPKAATIQVDLRQPRTFVTPTPAPIPASSETQEAIPTGPVQVSPEVPQSLPPETGEVLIPRAVTFRNSTFGGLKAFIREHRGRTGVALTNAAAVDLLLREHLPSRISRRAGEEMKRLSVHNGMLKLLGVQERGEA